MNPELEILYLLRKFQDGYSRRDLSQLDPFMELFSSNAEVIGTNGIRPGEGEWYNNRDTARGLVKGDWEDWGDLRLACESASIKVSGNIGWIATTATVSQNIGNENFDSFLEYIRKFIESSPLPAEQKIHYILRGGPNTIYELNRGENFTWPLQFTAVVVYEFDGWKFAQVHFSFPTIFFPDVRIMDDRNSV